MSSISRSLVGREKRCLCSPFLRTFEGAVCPLKDSRCEIARIQMRVADQPHHSLEAHAPGPFENRLAIGAVVVSVLTLAAVAPFARVPLGEIKPFISIYQS